MAHVVDEWDLEDEWRTWDCLICDGTEEKLKDCGKLEYDFYDTPRVVGHAGVRCKGMKHMKNKLTWNCGKIITRISIRIIN